LGNDPQKFKRSPRLQWLVQTFFELVDESERERARLRKNLSVNA
jgi:hypothetical protein